MWLCASETRKKIDRTLNIFQDRKRLYLPHCYSDKGWKGTVVNRTVTLQIEGHINSLIKNSTSWYFFFFFKIILFCFTFLFCEKKSFVVKLIVINRQIGVWKAFTKQKVLKSCFRRNLCAGQPIPPADRKWRHLPRVWFIQS